MAMPDTSASKTSNTMMDMEALLNDYAYAVDEHARNEGSNAAERKVRHTRAALLSRLEAQERELKEAWQELTDCEGVPGFDHNDALQVLCRAFDNWEPIYDEWLDWYKPTDWIHMSRGFGAFMRKVLNERNTDDEKRELLASVAARYKTIGELNARCASLQGECDELSAKLDDAKENFDVVFGLSDELESLRSQNADMMRIFEVVERWANHPETWTSDGEVARVVREYRASASRTSTSPAPTTPSTTENEHG